MRLSEILGRLSYLRELCAARDGDSWRTRMNALLEAEATSEARRERLAGAFNKGYRDYQITYRSCTPNAALVIDPCPRGAAASRGTCRAGTVGVNFTKYMKSLI